MWQFWDMTVVRYFSYRDPSISVSLLSLFLILPSFVISVGSCSSFILSTQKIVNIFEKRAPCLSGNSASVEICRSFVGAREWAKNSCLLNLFAKVDFPHSWPLDSYVTWRSAITFQILKAKIVVGSVLNFYHASLSVFIWLASGYQVIENFDRWKESFVVVYRHFGMTIF